MILAMNHEDGLASPRISCKKRPWDYEKQLIPEQHLKPPDKCLLQVNAVYT